MKQIALRLPPELYERIQEAAKGRGTASELIRQGALELVERIEREKRERR